MRVSVTQFNPKLHRRDFVRMSTLPYTTLHYTTLHYTTIHYTTLDYPTLHPDLDLHLAPPLHQEGVPGLQGPRRLRADVDPQRCNSQLASHNIFIKLSFPKLFLLLCVFSHACKFVAFKADM